MTENQDMNLYNKERPMLYGNVVGQDKVITQIKGLTSSEDMPTAFLFIGPRGTGKTTVARIMARYVNCASPSSHEPCNSCPSCRAILAGTSMDVIELDAASNNKVEDIRNLIQSTQYAAIGKKKVYILDEVHMLSQGAFNALLKTLEEPPADCLFILCTTEEHKVPATIQSRCSRFFFEKMDTAVIADYLASVCNKYKVAYEMDALKLIARASDGCMRDALSILEPRMLNECLSTEVIRDHMGLSGEDAVFDIIQGILHGNAVQATGAFREATKRGNSAAAIFKDIVSACCDITYALQSGTTEGIMHTEQYIQRVASVSQTASATEILRIADGLSEIFSSSTNNNAGFLMEMGILKLIAKESSLSALEHKVTLLEEQITALRNGYAETVNEQAPNRAVISESQDINMAGSFDAPSDGSGVIQDKSPYPDTEEFGTDLPGDSSSSERCDLPADSSILPYPQQLTEGNVLDDGSKITGSIDLFGTSGQSQNTQPATAYNDDIMDIGAFAGFARL